MFYDRATIVRKARYTVFHDDQHGTAIVATAGLLNALTYQVDIKNLKWSLMELVQQVQLVLNY